MSDEQTLSYEEPQNTEVLNEEEQDSLEVGEKMEAEQEQLLAGKYKNAEELEKAHIELQKKLGEKSEPVSDEPKSNNEPENKSSKNTEPNLLDQIWEEGTQNKVSKETFEKLSKMNPVELAKMAMEQRANFQNTPQTRQFTSQEEQQLQGLVGGKENYSNMMSWANQNISEREVQMYDAVMDSGNPMAAYFAIQSIALKYQDKVGKDGQMITGKAPKSTADVFKSQAEMVKAMEDSRYDDDPAYRDAIMNKIARSNINF